MPTVQNAKRGVGVKGGNINASVLNEDERNQEGIHNTQEVRPEAPKTEKR